MKLGFALLAGLLISTSANAGDIGVFAQQQANSDILTVVIADNISTHPYCKGQLEARAIMTWGGSDRGFARGCWRPSSDRKTVFVEMYAYSDGREISFPIKAADIKVIDGFRLRGFLTLPEQDAKPKSERTSAKSDADELYGAATSTRDDVSMYYAGVCEAMRLAEANAQTPEQKKMADAIRDAIVKTTDTEAKLVDDYCDAKSRMFHTAQR